VRTGSRALSHFRWTWEWNLWDIWASGILVDWFFWGRGDGEMRRGKDVDIGEIGEKGWEDMREKW
jgi:hypothetical protein